MRIPFWTHSAKKTSRSPKSSRSARSKGALERRAAQPLAAAYYPDWASGTNPPASLDFSKFDVLLFAFAEPNANNGLSWDSGATSTLNSLVSAAHNSGHGTRVVLSIGGWDGSYYFSQVMSSPDRATFVQACVNAVNTHNLDGIDIDWEYPNESGAGNPYSASDAANLLDFFTSLRSALGPSKIISAAVTDLPWTGPNGSPLTDVSAYAKQMTYVNIMNYDVFSASASAPGPNAPLGNLCGTSSLPKYSAEAAVNQWTAAGFPAGQLVLGLPLYGYVSQSTRTSLTEGTVQPVNRMAGELGGPLDEAVGGAHPRALAASARRPGNVTARAAGDLNAYYGQAIAFNELVALGALQETSYETFTQANGYTEGWDDCSDTPYLFDTARATVVTYDDTYSLGDKATYAKNAGLAGVFTWSLDQDYGYALQNSILSGLGL